MERKLTEQPLIYRLEDYGVLLKEHFMTYEYSIPIHRHIYQRHRSNYTVFMKKRRWENTTVEFYRLKKDPSHPLSIPTAYGGCSPQATSYHKRLAEKICQKRNDSYAKVVSTMRTRVRFSILRSVLMAVRGERGKWSGYGRSISDTAFSLIPEAQEYECH